jgi:hypothetical protein
MKHNSFILEKKKKQQSISTIGKSDRKKLKIPPFEKKQDRVDSCPLDSKGSLQALPLVSLAFKVSTPSPLPVSFQIDVAMFPKVDD